MSGRVRDLSRLRRLTDLAGEPEAQARQALGIVERERSLELLLPALDVLARQPPPEARPVLLARYVEWERAGKRGDVGGHVRAPILRALRPLALPEDVPLIERAVTAYEFKPLDGEVAHPLRAAGLVVLADLDPELAGYHAARLLDDAHTARMSGEPAVTAARVLAVVGQPLPLYGYALRGPALGNPVADVPWLPHPDVLGECLRQLTALPRSLLRPLVARYTDARNPLAVGSVLAGLVDLVLHHPHRADVFDLLLDLLRATRHVDVYRYAATVIVAKRRDDLLPLLVELARTERSAERRAILAEAVALRPADPALAPLRAVIGQAG
jgi:hypothetical protein